MKRRHVFLTDAQWKGLESWKAKTGLTVAELIRRAIDDYLRRQK